MPSYSKILKVATIVLFIAYAIVVALVLSSCSVPLNYQRHGIYKTYSSPPKYKSGGYGNYRSSRDWH